MAINRIYPAQMQPPRHEKLEWSRMAQSAYNSDRNDWGHRYSAYSYIRDASTIPLTVFDTLQLHYRQWLIGGWTAVEAGMDRAKLAGQTTDESEAA